MSRDDWDMNADEAEQVRTLLDLPQLPGHEAHSDGVFVYCFNAWKYGGIEEHLQKCLASEAPLSSMQRAALYQALDII